MATVESDDRCGHETRKGTTLMWIAPGNAEAGWGFNSDYDVIVGYDGEGMPIYGRMPPAQANALLDSAIQSNSFFYAFDDEELYEANGSSFLLDSETDVRKSSIYGRLLADAIPSLSNPTGRNSLGTAVQENKDYMLFKRGLHKDGDWPDSDDIWRHSYIREIAYPFNFAVFDEIVIDGGLR